MNELQDKELDDLFKKSLTGLDIPFNPAAWKGMEAKLDLQDVRRAGYFRTVRAMAAALLLVTGSGFLLLFSDKGEPAYAVNTIHKVHEQQTPAFRSNTHKRPSGSGSAGKEFHDAKQQSVHLSGRQDTRKPDVLLSGHTIVLSKNNVQHERAGEGRIFRNSDTADAMFITSSDTEGFYSQSYERLLVFSKQTDSLRASSDMAAGYMKPDKVNTQAQTNQFPELIRSENKTTSYTVPGDYQIPTDTNGTASFLVMNHSSGKTGKLNNSTSIYDSVAVPDTQAVAIVRTDSVKGETGHAMSSNTHKNEFKKGFSVSVLLNPEYTSPLQGSVYKPALNIGINAEYYLSHRFSILSGIIYGSKLYASDQRGGGASSEPYTLQGNEYHPDHVKANCHVIDIPLNARYKFLNKNAYAVYVSGGLTSYLLLMERYTFEYKEANEPAEKEEQMNKNRYLFNCWNISLGIEKRISTKWALQAEPYVKLPLMGIGAGDVKLISTGMYFSLKYYMNK